MNFLLAIFLIGLVGNRIFVLSTILSQHNMFELILPTVIGLLFIPTLLTRDFT